jgi:Helix-turn-helix domain
MSNREMSNKETLMSSAALLPTIVEGGSKSGLDATPLGDRGDGLPSLKRAPDAPQRRRRSSRQRKRRRPRRPRLELPLPDQVAPDSPPHARPALRAPQSSVADNDLLTTAEYAEYRRCSPRTVERERETGKGCPYVRLGARVLYRRTDIQRYVEQNVRGLEGGTE